MMRTRVVIPVVVAAALLGGCRSGGGSAAPTHRFAAYRQCLEQHGVTPHRRMDQGTTSSTDPASAAAFVAARQACAKLRPTGGLRSGGPSTHRRRAFRQCLKDHGVALPTTTTGAKGIPAPSGGGRGGMLAGLDRNDPTVAAALQACRSRLVSPATSTSTRP
jgi:DNA-binding LacI/PurR family transcriptional regulator